MARKASRRSVLKSGAAAALGLAGGAFAQVLTRRGGRHILLVIADALRGDRVGRVVNGREVTPHLNALARRGVCFRRAYAPAPWTKTSVASILSGRLAPYHGVAHHSFTLPDIPTIPSFLAHRGYFTVSVQTNPWLEGEIDRAGAGRRPAGFGFNNPFRVYRYEEPVAAPADAPLGIPYAEAERVIASFFRTIERLRPPGGAGGAPVFAYLHFMDTHQPWLVGKPTAFTGAFHEPALSGRLGAEGVFELDYRTIKRVLFDERHAPPVDGDAGLLGAINDEAAANFDRHWGILESRLREKGLWDDATVIFTADHGDELWEHGRLGHGQNLYNTSLHVPLVIKRPGLAACEVDARVSNAAIFATIREWFGEGDAPNAIVQSLAPCLSPGRQESALIHANYVSSGKLILPDGRTVISGPRPQFFNIASDPGEKRPMPADDSLLGELEKVENASKMFAKLDGVVHPLSTHPWQWRRDERFWKGAGIGVDADALSPAKREQLRALGYLN